MPQILPEGITLTGPLNAGFADILTLEALGFVAGLSRRFERRRQELMQKREVRQAQFDAGALPDFLPETRAVRDGDWAISPVPRSRASFTASMRERLARPRRSAAGPRS